MVAKDSHCRGRVKLEACCTTIHSYLCRTIVLLTTELTEEVYVFLLLFFDRMYLSRIRFFADTDRLKMSLFVVVTTNSVSSWAIFPVVALASTPKTGTVLYGGLFHESFVSVTLRLVVCGLLFVLRAWLTEVMNFVLSFYLTDNGSILFSCFGLSAHVTSVRKSEVKFSL